MMFGDFGTFSMLWIILNLFFLLALIISGLVLSSWVSRRIRRKRQQPDEAGSVATLREDLEKSYARGNINREQYEQMQAQLNNS